MALQFIGRPVAYERLLELLEVDPAVGAPASHIVKLATVGVGVTYGSGTLEDIIDHLSRGQVCIAFVHTLQLSYWDQATRHAVVVVGADDDHILVADPWFDTISQTVSRLEFQFWSLNKTGVSEGREKRHDGRA